LFVRHRDAMRIIFILILLLLGSSLRAGIPTYSGLRNCVEQENPTNSIPASERLFICPDYHHDMCPNFQETFILHYKDGITLRQIVDETKFKGTSVDVWVFRKSDAPVFRAPVQPTDKPAFAVKPEDVILIYVKILDM
jgi:hypothetical protein